MDLSGKGHMFKRNWPFMSVGHSWAVSYALYYCAKAVKRVSNPIVRKSLSSHFFVRGDLCFRQSHGSVAAPNTDLQNRLLSYFSAVGSQADMTTMLPKSWVSMEAGFSCSDKKMRLLVDSEGKKDEFGIRRNRAICQTFCPGLMIYVPH